MWVVKQRRWGGGMVTLGMCGLLGEKESEWWVRGPCLIIVDYVC